MLLSSLYGFFRSVKVKVNYDFSSVHHKSTFLKSTITKEEYNLLSSLNVVCLFKTIITKLDNLVLVSNTQKLTSLRTSINVI